jgi:hypothetical protein
MPSVKVPTKVNPELAAYSLSKHFINKHYLTDVKTKDENTYSTYIYKERILKNVIGTPTVIRATFFGLEDGTGLEVEFSSVKMTPDNVVREVLNTIILPFGAMKLLQMQILKDQAFKQAIKILRFMSKENKS